MEEFTLKNKHNVPKSSIVGIIVGLPFLIFGLFAINLAFSKAKESYDQINYGNQSVATVIGFETYTRKGNKKYAPIYEFTDDIGRLVKLVSPDFSGTQEYYVGDKVEVLYTKGKVEKARIKGFKSLWLDTILAGFLGLIFTTIGLYIVKSYFYDRKMRSFLATDGKEIKAEVITIDYTTRNKGANYWQIRAQWHDNFSNTIYQFNSEYLYINPKSFVGDTVSVIIDPKNPTRYFMDLSFLPKRKF